MTVLLPFRIHLHNKKIGHPLWNHYEYSIFWLLKKWLTLQRRRRIIRLGIGNIRIRGQSFPMCKKETLFLLNPPYREVSICRAVVQSMSAFFQHWLLTVVCHALTAYRFQYLPISAVLKLPWFMCSLSTSRLTICPRMLLNQCTDQSVPIGGLVRLIEVLHTL